MQGKVRKIPFIKVLPELFNLSFLSSGPELASIIKYQYVSHHHPVVVIMIFTKML